MPKGYSLLGRAMARQGVDTAFFIMGAQAAEAWCARHPEVAALVVPAPAPGEPLRMLRFGIDFEDAPARA